MGHLRRGLPSRSALGYRTISAEGEWAFGYTRFSGEWVRSRFDVPGDVRTLVGWTAQVQQTLTPRVFAHSRLSTIQSPEDAIDPAAISTTRHYLSIDTTLGYRVTPDLTLRTGHAAVRGFATAPIDHQLGLSMVWARRWW